MVRKKRTDFFDDEFDRIRDEMDRLIDEAFNKDISEFKTPIVYGFSMKVGPDGKPVVREFGNTKTGESMEEREPLVDIIEEESTITVIAEIPGVNKEDVQVSATNDTLTMKVDTVDRKYSKTIELPCDVKSDSAKANYKNGILEVKLDRKDKKPPSNGKKIPVE